ncbi:hypothetical protein MRX96_058839 [Rhipicephalus microplus]
MKGVSGANEKRQRRHQDSRRSKDRRRGRWCAYEEVKVTGLPGKTAADVSSSGARRISLSCKSTSPFRVKQQFHASPSGAVLLFTRSPEGALTLRQRRRRRMPNLPTKDGENKRILRAGGEKHAWNDPENPPPLVHGAVGARNGKTLFEAQKQGKRDAQATPAVCKTYLAASVEVAQKVVAYHTTHTTHQFQHKWPYRADDSHHSHHTRCVCRGLPDRPMGARQRTDDSTSCHSPANRQPAHNRSDFI